MIKNSSAFGLLTLFVFTSWPFVFFVSHNLNKGVIISDLLDIYIVFNLVMLLGYIAACKLTGSNGKPLNCLIVLTVACYNFSAFAELLEGLDNLYILILYLLLIFSLILATWKLSRPDIQSYGLFLFLAVIMYMPGFIKVVKFSFDTNQQLRADSNGYEFLNSQIINKKSNVYFIVADGFGRSDVLNTQFKYDNSLFLSKLKSRDFYVADQSVANYPLTYLSISSTLNMNYVLAEGPSSLKSRKPFYPYIQGDNAVVQFFKGQGYQYIHSYSQHWPGSKCASELIDDCHYQGQKDDALFKNTETVNNFLKLTPFYSSKYLGSNSDSLKEVTNKVSEVLSLSDTPLFLFAHVLTPHPPNSYGEDCTTVPVKSALNNWEAKSYIIQVKCVEDDLVTLVDTILSLDKEEPIIIIQSDHGPAVRKQFAKQKSDWNDEDIIERYGVLNAIHIHSACRDNLYPSMSLVNTFRIVSACLLGRSPELLADTAMFATYEESLDYGLITPILQQ